MGDNINENISYEFSPDSIKFIGESVGIAGLQDDCLQMLANDITYRLKMLVQDSKKFLDHGKRSKLSTNDIDCSLKVRAIEPLYGFHALEHIPFRYASGGGRDIQFIEEKELDLQDVLNSSIPKVPLEVSIRPHWLSIEGIQPLIPENPAPFQRDAPTVNLTDPTILNNSLNKSSIGIENLKVKDKQIMPEKVRIKEMSTHELSVEQQIFYKEITEACVGSDENRRVEALNSLTTDPGLYQMLPRLSTFIAEGVKVNIVQNNLALLIYLMRMVKALMENSSLYLEKYLHELIPPLVSCIISRQLCLRPDSDNHWALRDFAARLICQVCKSFNSSTNNMQTRITKLLAGVLQNESAPLATHYGAIVSLGELGSEVVKVFILPFVKGISDRLSGILDNSLGMGIVITSIDKTAAEHVKSSLLKILPQIIRNIRSPPDIMEEYQQDYGYLGYFIHSAVIKLRHSSTMTNNPFGQNSNSFTSIVLPTKTLLPLSGNIRPTQLTSHILRTPIGLKPLSQSVSMSFSLTNSVSGSLNITPTQPAQKVLVLTSQQRFIPPGNISGSLIQQTQSVLPQNTNNTPVTPQVVRLIAANSVVNSQGVVPILPKFITKSLESDNSKL